MSTTFTNRSCFLIRRHRRANQPLLLQELPATTALMPECGGHHGQATAPDPTLAGFDATSLSQGESTGPACSPNLSPLKLPPTCLPERPCPLSRPWPPSPRPLATARRPKRLRCKPILRPRALSAGTASIATAMKSTRFSATFALAIKKPLMRCWPGWLSRANWRASAFVTPAVGSAAWPCP